MYFIFHHQGNECDENSMDVKKKSDVSLANVCRQSVAILPSLRHLILDTIPECAYQLDVEPQHSLPQKTFSPAH